MDEYYDSVTLIINSIDYKCYKFIFNNYRNLQDFQLYFSIPNINLDALYESIENEIE